MGDENFGGWIDRVWGVGGLNAIVRQAAPVVLSVKMVLKSAVTVVSSTISVVDCKHRQVSQVWLATQKILMPHYYLFRHSKANKWASHGLSLYQVILMFTNANP